MPDVHANQNIDYDILIIGGGINGAGIAREATAAGYTVCVCDSGDFGGGTSSASTKLIHGGLRYLEHYEFRLVREALMEREVLWQMAPHIIWPMRFVLPHHRGLRPRWLLRLGLFLYDNLGGRKKLPATRSLNLQTHETGSVLKDSFTRGFEYSDCWVEDSRLVILNLQDAQQMGCSVRSRTRVSKANFDNGVWKLQLADTNGKTTETVTARLVVNAAGPWVDSVLQQVFGVNDVNNIRLVKGSHIVIKKKFEHDRSYIFQNSDNRIIFAIPYENEYTLIGTTDVDHPSIETKPEISAEEISYLCKMASEYFSEPVEEKDIVWTYSGVRPLYNDGATAAQEATRDYVIEVDDEVGNGRLVNIFGGKLTTFRKLAFSVLERTENILGSRTRRNDVSACYPGGDFSPDGYEQLVSNFQSQYAFLPEKVTKRLVRLYGTRTGRILDGCSSLPDLGIDFGHGLYEKEVHYLVENEWTQTAQDILFRRTKLGILMNKKQVAKLDDYLNKQDVPVEREKVGN